MALTYDIIDRDGREISSMGSVLAPVALTGVETTSASNIVTVASTASLYPGMPVAIPNVPAGSFIHAIVGSTSIELLRSVFSSGAWTTVAANANATASDTGLSGHAYGFHWACIVAQDYAMGMWRNLHASRSMGQTNFASTLNEVRYHDAYGRGVAIVPTAGSWSGTVYTPSASDMRISDDLAASPAKRHNGEMWSVRPFVLTGGAVAHIPARPDWCAVCSAVA